MPEKKTPVSWKQRFLASRMSFESLLFERELVVQGKESYAAGLAGAFCAALAASLLLAQWVLRQGYFFSPADAAGFQTVAACAEHLGTGGLLGLFIPVTGDFSAVPPAPLYYFTYVPVLRFLTSEPVKAMLLVNSFYLAFLSLAVFTAIKKHRNNRSGWLGSLFAMAAPFVFETARHPDHRLAGMALAAAAYAAYINSEDFEIPAWNVWVGIFFGLGFYADAKFWMYMAPLVPFMLNGLLGRLSSGSIIGGLLPGAALSAPLYLCLGVLAGMKYTSGMATADFATPGYKVYLAGLAGAAGLPFFALGAAAVVWMYFSVFMPYTAKKMVAAWSWVPLLINYFLYGGRIENTYPALIPLCIAAAVMLPGRPRKYFMVLAAAVLVVNQSGRVPPLHIKGIRAVGSAGPAAARDEARELMKALKSRASAGGVYSAALVGEDERFSHISLNYLSDHLGGPKIKFAVYKPDMIGLADFVVYRSAAFKAERRDASSAPARELSRPWFAASFSQAAAFDLADTTRLVLYEKNSRAAVSLKEGKHRLKNMTLGDMAIEEGVLTLSGLDPARGVYSRASFFSPYVIIRGFDIYGLELEMQDFSCISESGTPFDMRITGAGKVRIVSARATNYSFERYLTDNYAGLENIEVKIDGSLRALGRRNGKAVFGKFSMAARSPVLTLTLEDFMYDWLTMPGFMTGIVKFKYDLSLLFPNIEFGKTTLMGEVLEIS